MSVEQLRAMPIIEVGAAICRLHWEHYAARLPGRVMPVFLLKMFEEIAKDEAFAKACKFWRPEPEKWDWPTDFSVMNHYMRSAPFVPWCTYLGRERLEAAWLETPYRIKGES